MAAGILIGGKLNVLTSGVSSLQPHKKKLHKLIDFIEREYVDYVNTDSIVDLTVDGILKQLDPHSVYIPSSEFDEVSQSMKGDFVGIGVNFYMYKDTVAVIKPIEGGPSEKAGLMAGDRILYAGKDKLFGRNWPSDSLFSRLKGQRNSEIELTVYRKSENKELKFTFKRDVVPIKSVDVALMLNANTGYIKINRFAETTYKEFQKSLEKLVNAGAQTLILDLRDNGGGYLEKAVQIADEFLEKDALIVFTKNKKGRLDKTTATSKGSFENGNIRILINENTASASEILAGAIQDNDRGVLLGRRTFGKGLVQREMKLDDGSAVRLTVARYYTPSGRSIQKPYNGDLDAYYKDFGSRFDSGELFEKDSIKVIDSLSYKTLKGRTVYGGGGIVPDIFVPLESKHGEEALESLMQTGLVGYFVFEQIDQNRNAFSGLSFEAFQIKMEYTELYYNNFRDYLNQTGLNLRIGANKSLVKRYLYAEFARQLFDETKYYEIILKDDKMVKAALAIED